ncbi:hypothetical protein HMPREF9148_00935 [Prevotella sp. F0091]|nr:hypothetical protein HMPREF9148_00935 [Prevotella sp. F0091]
MLLKPTTGFVFLSTKLLTANSFIVFCRKQLFILHLLFISERLLSRIIFMKINIYGREEKYFFS